jgi:hypothetical protein
MTQDKNWAKGLYLKARHPNTPSFVKATLDIKVDEFVACLQQYRNANGWVTIHLKESGGGKKYFEVDTWQPPQQRQQQTQRQPAPPVAPQAPAYTPQSAGPQYAPQAPNGQPMPANDAQGYVQQNPPPAAPQHIPQDAFNVGQESVDDIPF